MKFGEKLKTLRTNLGKSQTEVSEEISSHYPDFSISQAYLSTLEKRETAPREQVLDVLSEYFGIPATYFLTDDETADTEDMHQRRLSVAQDWIENVRNANKTGKILARSEGFRKEDDEIAKSLERMRKLYDEDDELLDF